MIKKILLFLLVGLSLFNSFSFGAEDSDIFEEVGKTDLKVQINDGVISDSQQLQSYNNIKAFTNVIGWDIFYKAVWIVNFYLMNNKEFEQKLGGERTHILFGKVPGDDNKYISAKSVIEAVGTIKLPAIITAIVIMSFVYYYLFYRFPLTGAESEQQDLGNGRKGVDKRQGMNPGGMGGMGGMGGAGGMGGVGGIGMGGRAGINPDENFDGKITFLEFLKNLNKIRMNDETNEETKKTAKWLLIYSVLLTLVVITSVSYMYSRTLDLATNLSLIGFNAIAFVVLIIFVTNLIILLKNSFAGIVKVYYSSDDLDLTQIIFKSGALAIGVNIILLGMVASFVINSFITMLAPIS